MAALLHELAHSSLNDGHIRGVLITSRFRKISVFHHVKLPDFELEYDALHSSVSVSKIEDLGPGDQSSITAEVQPGWSLSLDQLRTIVHDFTFRLFSDATDIRLDGIFDSENDGNDDLTPDAVIQNENICAIFEFTTTRNPANLVTPYNTKMYKYKEPIKTRVMNSPHVDRIYTYSPIVVTVSDIALPEHLAIRQSVVDELCARFLFACRLFDAASDLGLPLGENDQQQSLLNIREILRHLPATQGEKQINGSHLVYSRESIESNEISEKEALSYVSTLYHTLLHKNLDSVPLSSELDSDIQKKISEYTSSIIGDREDLKAVIQLPGVLPEDSSLSDIEEAPGPGDATKEVWNAIIAAEHNGELNLEEYTEDEMERLSMETSTQEEKDTYKEMKSQYHRVKVELSFEHEIELASIGVQGKKMAHTNDIVKEIRKEKKVGFSPTTPTSDIDDWINAPMSELRLKMTQNCFSTFGLITEGINLHDGCPRELLDITKNHVARPEHVWCQMVSDIGSELSISLRQGVKKNTFIYKKLREFGLHMAIRPTRSDSHIFVSFMIKNQPGNLVIIPSPISKMLKNYGPYSATEFTSFNVSKLVNIVKAESFSVAMLHQWRRFYKLKTGTSSLGEAKIFPMWKLSLLINLDDKHTTEELCTLFRYISMEKFVLSSPEPTKVLTKFPQTLRSRLQVWILARLLLTLKDPLYDHIPPSAGEETRLWSWNNLINPYTRETITDPNDLVEIYYLGYAKNKDEVSSSNTDMQLMNKILKHEVKLYSANSDFLGKTSPELPVPTEIYQKHLDLVEDLDVQKPSLIREAEQDEIIEDLKTHEFSKHCVCAAADTLKIFWNELYGKNWSQRVSDGILQRFNRITWEQIATLKASSKFDPQEKPVVGEKQVTSRMKVIIALLKQDQLIKEKPYMSLPEILEWVDNDGGLRIDIFKKNQHGGLREIYVLELRSRLLQLFIEEVARFICSTIPSEMMMHPQSKIRRPQEHIIRAGTRSESHKMSCYSSNDAATWNQGHYVPKFQMFLIRCLPVEFHNFIDVGMSQWLQKRMKLPDGIYNLFRRQPKTKYYDPIDQKLSNAFQGVETEPWMNKEDNYVTVASGMMQGILHYTSSAYHAAVLMLRDRLFKHTMKALHIGVMTTDLVSSDDSSRLSDVFSNDLETCQRGLIYSRSDHLLMKTFSTFFGIWMSVKSTMCTNQVLEFNSEFYFKASLARPTIKWSYAALNIIEVESLFERQEVMSNLITELLEGGSGFSQAFGTQIAQALLYYKLLGSGVNKLWNRYAFQLARVRDPSLGFFLISHPLAAGLLGLNYDLWNAQENGASLAKRLAYQLRGGDITSTTRGTLMNGVQIRFGDRAKVLKLFAEAEKVYPDWREHIEEQPEVLYMLPKTRDEIFTRMLIKLTSPNVTASLAKGNTISRMISSSVYIISHNATSLGKAWLDVLEENVDEVKRKKVSLMKLVKMEVEEATLTAAERKALFPKVSSFEEISLILRELSRDVLVPSPFTKKLRSHIMVYPDATETAFSLEQMCRWKWFDQRLPTSNRVLLWTWNHYLELYPWLRETVQATLEESPFSSHVTLRNFIARQQDKSRMVHLTGSPVKTPRTNDAVMSALILNQRPGYMLKNIRDGEDGQVAQTHLGTSLVNDLATVLLYPFKDENMKIISEAVLNDYPVIWDGSVIRPSPRLQRLGIIQEAIKQKMHLHDKKPDLLMDMVMISKSGCLGGWAKRQKHEAGMWRGRGVWLGITGSTRIRLTLLDDMVTSMSVSSIEQARRDRNLVNALLNDLKCKPDMNKLGKSPSGWRWTGSTFSRELNGCPVFEEDIYIASEIHAKDLDIQCKQGSIRLFWTLDRAKINICSYHVSSGDLNWMAVSNIPSKTKAFECWRKNMSMEPNAAKKLLRLFMEKELKKTSAQDPERVKHFYKNLLLSSMRRYGFSTISSQVFEEIDPYADIMDQYTDDYLDKLLDDNMGIFLDNVVSDQLPTEGQEELRADSPDIEFGVESGAHLMDDIDFSFISKTSVATAFYANHTFFDRLLSSWFIKAGSRGISMLSGDKYPMHFEEEAEIINFYLDKHLEPGSETLSEDLEEDEDEYED